LYKRASRRIFLLLFRLIFLLIFLLGEYGRYSRTESAGLERIGNDPEKSETADLALARGLAHGQAS
jgi:hypothetical protein